MGLEDFGLLERQRIPLQAYKVGAGFGLTLKCLKRQTDFRLKIIYAQDLVCTFVQKKKVENEGSV